MLGNADYCDGINRAEEALVKLGDEVETWFNSLNEDEKLVVLESTYPDQVGMISSDELWDRTIWNNKLDIYKGTNGYGEGVRV